MTMEAWHFVGKCFEMNVCGFRISSRDWRYSCLIAALYGASTDTGCENTVKRVEKHRGDVVGSSLRIDPMGLDLRGVAESSVIFHA